MTGAFEGPHPHEAPFGRKLYDIVLIQKALFLWKRHYVVLTQTGREGGGHCSRLLLESSDVGTPQYFSREGNPELKSSQVRKLSEFLELNGAARRKSRAWLGDRFYQEAAHCSNLQRSRPPCIIAILSRHCLVGRFRGKGSSCGLTLWKFRDHRQELAHRLGRIVRRKPKRRS